MKEFDIVSHIKVYAWDELSPDDRQLVQLAKDSTQRSYAPYSHFQVGAALRTVGGHIVTGCNQENPATPSSLCAERVALFAAGVQYPDEAVESIAIAAYTQGSFTPQPVPPCGACRQVMSAVSQRYRHPLRILLYGGSGIYAVDDIEALLPLQFEL